jgi:tetratricopeptide (TPR) repeat protein
MSGVGAIDLQASLEAAYAAYRAGRPDDALTALDRVLRVAPGEPNALNLLGAVRLAQGDAAAASEALGRAARAQPKNPEIQNNLGSALRRAGRAGEAETAYRRALAVRPEYAEAHYNLGNLLAETGRAEEAAAAYRRAVGIRADYAAAYIGLGRAKEQTGDWKRAEEAYRLAVEVAPKNAQAHLALARVIEKTKSGDFFVHIETARALAPDDAAIACAYGVALARVGRIEEAYAAFQHAIARDPKCADARVNIGNILTERGETERALVHYMEALEVDERCVEAMMGVGNVAEREGRLAEAEGIFRRALAIDPDCAAAHSNLGAVLKAVGRRDAAIACFERALALQPDHADALANLGHARMDKGDWSGAHDALDRALGLAPEHADARLNRATLRLLTGDFAGGWRDYLARDVKQSVGIGVHRLPLPADLRGYHILVLPDQGLGDELFFLRFAPGLRARGATVLYRASPRIAAMVERSHAVDRVIAADEIPPGLSLTVSVGDLPHLLGMASAAEIPPTLSLPTLREASAAMAARLAALGPEPYIGVTWRAGTANRKNGLYKEVPRAKLARALAKTSGTLIALQRLPLEGEVATFAREAGRPVHDLTALNDTLEDMLALLSELDDYVCVSNTNVHLRAGTGEPSRVLMPHPPEFRWMADGDSSPWFPGTHIYRQRPDGDWDAALSRLEEELQ